MHLRKLLITIALATVGVAAAVTPAGAAATTAPSDAAASSACVPVRGADGLIHFVCPELDNTDQY